MNSLHKWPITRKMFPFDDVIMRTAKVIKYHSIVKVNTGNQSTWTHYRKFDYSKTAELWCLHCECFGENWPRYNGTALYVVYKIIVSYQQMSPANRVLMGFLLVTKTWKRRIAGPLCRYPPVAGPWNAYYLRTDSQNAVYFNIFFVLSDFVNTLHCWQEFTLLLWWRIYPS